jgi:hypothetical protein
MAQLHGDARERFGLADAQVILTHGGQTHVLYSADGFVDGPHFKSSGLGIWIAMASWIL